MAEFIYTMRKARKAHGDKVILDDVTLSFLPGREDRRRRPQRRRQVHRAQDHGGARPAVQRRRVPHARATPSASSSRSRSSTRTRTCSATSRRALGRDQGASSTATTRSPRRWPIEYSDELIDRDGRAAGGASTTPTPGTSTPSSSRRWTRCAARRRTPTCRCSPAARSAGSRCASCCSSQPDLLLLDEPTNHLDAESVQWLEQHLEKYAGTVVAVTHDRYFLDNVAEWILELDRGRAYPYEGNYSTYLETKQTRLKVEGAEGRQAREAAQGRARVGALQRQGPPGQEQGAPRALRGDGRRGREDPQARLRGDPDPAGPAAGQRRRRGRRTSPRASATGCSSTTCRSRCRATASSASSAPTAPARPRCSR